MEEKILKLIYDYSKKERMIDRDYIDKVIDIIVNSLTLHRYLKGVDFFTNEKLQEKNKQKNCIQLANQSDLADLIYDWQDYKIIVYVDNILKIYQYLNRKNKADFGKEELSYFKTTIYTQRILHELEHADQARTKEEKNNFASNILRVSIVDNMEIDNSSSKRAIENIARFMVYFINYVEDYKYAPHERMAQIKSFQKMLSILLQGTIDLPNIVHYLKDMVLENSIIAYKDTFSPTIKYIQGVDEIFERDSLSEFNWYSNNEEECLNKSIKKYSFEERLQWGLPIESEKRLELLQELKLTKYGHN